MTPASCAGHARRQACERREAGWRVVEAVRWETPPSRRSTCTAAEARFAERTDWLGPDPARCFDCPVDPVFVE